MKLIQKVTNYEVKLNEYKTKYEKEIINQEAIVCFDRIYKGLKENNDNIYKESLLIESFITRKYTYYETEKSCNELLHGTEKTYNHYYTDIFIDRLKELAKEKGLFVEVKVIYDEETENHFMTITLENNVYFKKNFGVSLEEYYKAEKGIETVIDDYKEEIEKLKKALIRYLIKDKESGLDGEFAQHDAYMGLLMLNNKYKELKGKEQIITEIFEVDNDSQLLKLKK